MGYELIIFDLDGTILDTLDDLTAAVNFALFSCGLPARTREQVRGFVGNGIRKLIERAVPAGADAALTEKAYTAFCEYYATHFADATKPYDGITALLQELSRRKIRAAVVSNKSDREVKLLCDRFFPGLFNAAEGARQGLPRKPSPELVNAVLISQALCREKALYVGDSGVDAATAANAGIDFIGVGWGFCGEAALRELGIKTIARSPAQLAKLIAADE